MAMMAGKRMVPGQAGRVGSVSRVSSKLYGHLIAASLLMALAGCSKTDTADVVAVEPQPGTQMAQAAPADSTLAGAQPAVIQGACPQVYMTDDGAVHRAYAKGGTDDPMKILYQPPSATRPAMRAECRKPHRHLVVQGRVVLGPVGQPGSSACRSA